MKYEWIIVILIFFSLSKEREKIHSFHISFLEPLQTIIFIELCGIIKKYAPWKNRHCMNIVKFKMHHRVDTLIINKFCIYCGEGQGAAGPGKSMWMRDNVMQTRCITKKKTSINTRIVFIFSNCSRKDDNNHHNMGGPLSLSLRAHIFPPFSLHISFLAQWRWPHLHEAYFAQRSPSD